MPALPWTRSNAPRWHAALTSGADRPALRQALVDHLDRQVLPTWTAAELHDDRYGGFFNILDPEGHPVGQDFKPLVAHLRILHVHAVAVERGHDADGRLRRTVEDGLGFLERRFWDPVDPGWLHEVSSEGFPRDRQKQMTVQVYVPYILAEIHRMLGDDHALALARQTFELLETRAWDTINGGYRNDHSRPDDDPVNADRDVGTQFHAMLGLASLWRTDPRPDVRARLEALYQLATTRFVHQPTGHAHFRLAPDWQPLPYEPSRPAPTLYGHNVELTWYALATAEALGRNPAELRSWAEHAAAAFVRDGMTDDGAGLLFGHLDGAATDRRVVWWVPAEAMVMFLRMWQLIDDPVYYRHFESVTRWAFTHLVDPRTGLWSTVTDEHGRRLFAHPG
ncbi:MAG TPA: AGE family epimerase/isomerase, partial [Acidimicrobiia bacterium]|nr:AGE family epimerase/isomerase [Acidimicrobiia bacterium]